MQCTYGKFNAGYKRARAAEKFARKQAKLIEKRNCGAEERRRLVDGFEEKQGKYYDEENKRQIGNLRRRMQEAHKAMKGKKRNKKSWRTKDNCSTIRGRIWGDAGALAWKDIQQEIPK